MTILALFAVIGIMCVGRADYARGDCGEETIEVLAWRERAFWRREDVVEEIRGLSVVEVVAEEEGAQRMCMRIKCDGCRLEGVYGGECNKSLLVRRALANGSGRLTAELYGVRDGMWYAKVLSICLVSAMTAFVLTFAVVFFLKEKKEAVEEGGGEKKSPV